MNKLSSVNNLKAVVALALAGSAVGAFAQTGSAGSSAANIKPAASVQAAENSIDPENIRATVKYLSSDELEGRGPGLHGDALAEKYIAGKLGALGLKPAGDNATFLQKIHFVGTKVDAGRTAAALVPASGTALPLVFGQDFVVSDQHHTPSATVDAPIVFVGYGVTAPEFGWDDYAGVDVKGKVVLIIVGDPPSEDPKFFAGKALTYYGRWTYKYEQAARRGAVGALIIHRTDLASYGWDVVRNSWSGEKTYLRDDAKPLLDAASWIQLKIARKLFAFNNMDLEAQMSAAGKRGFHAVPLTTRFRAHITSTVRPFESANVVARLPGAARGQALVYSAHFDHLGMDPTRSGHKVFNGAVDNATGCGIVLEMARVWSKLTPPHDVFFAFVTAEEQGLLGSEYLGQHPPVPAGQIALDLNYDAVAPFGVPQEVSVTGAERTTFFPVVQQVAAAMHLAIVEDAHPEAGHYYRSDHFSLARVGVPAFSIGEGTLYEGHDAAWGLAKEDEYTAQRYHNVTDVYTEDMDFRGDAVMARFGTELGWRALTAKGTVGWTPGDEFEAARKRSAVSR